MQTLLSMHHKMLMMRSSSKDSDGEGHSQGHPHSFFVWFTVEIALVEAVVVLGLSFGKMFLQFAVFCYALSNALVA